MSKPSRSPDAATISRLWQSRKTWAEISREVGLPPEECQRIYEASRERPAAYITVPLVRFNWLLCRLLGHDWYECEPECCGQTLCFRCGTVKPDA